MSINWEVNQMIEEARRMNMDALFKAVSLLEKAVSENNYITLKDFVDNYSKDSPKSLLVDRHIFSPFLAVDIDSPKQSAITNYKIYSNAYIIRTPKNIYLLEGKYEADIIDKEISGIAQLGLLKYLFTKEKPKSKHEITHNFSWSKQEGVALNPDTNIYLPKYDYISTKI